MQKIVLEWKRRQSSLMNAIRRDTIESALRPPDLIGLVSDSRHTSDNHGFHAEDLEHVPWEWLGTAILEGEKATPSANLLRDASELWWILYWSGRSVYSQAISGG